MPLRAGLQRYPHIFTSASSDIAARTWVPCWDYARERCTWELELVAPRVLYSSSKQSVKHDPTGMELDRAGQNEEDEASDDDEEQDEEWPVTVIASGDLLESVAHPERSDKIVWHFIQATPISVQQVAWAMGPFVVMEFKGAAEEDKGEGEDGEEEVEEETPKEEGNQLHALCLPGREQEMAHAVGIVRQAMDHYSATIGSYPFSNTYAVAFVDSLSSGSPTFHSAGLTLFSSDILHPPTVIDQAYETRHLLAHALAIQWAGVNLIPAKPSDTWLIAGIALHVTAQFLRKVWGNNEYRFRVKKDMLRCVNQDVQRAPIADHTRGVPDPVQLQFIALKAPLVLHILDKYLRKSGTSLGLDKVLPKLFLDAFTSTAGTGSAHSSYNTLSTEKFMKLCRKACGASIEGLRTFFDQWVYGSGCPTFNVTANFNRKRMAIELNIAQECRAANWAASEQVPWHESSHLRPIQMFDGQMTIRIHEADGTPYEHVLNIQEHFKKHEVPFNTKYKRIRRNTKRYQARQAAATAAASGDTEAQEDIAALDVGFNLALWEDEAERERWRVEDWTEEDDNEMSQATYEWIRIDADLEWICNINFEQKDFMWISQLTRDRDVVAQLEAVHALSRMPSKIVASNLAKTVLVSNYFVRIRMEACLALVSCSTLKDDCLGLFYLLKLFQTWYCFEPEKEETDPFLFRCIPKTNDFSDLTDYFLRKTIVTALSLTRDPHGNTPGVVHQLLLDLLTYNDNLGNKFADTFYLTTIIDALAHIHVAVAGREYNQFALDDELDSEAVNTPFLAEAVDQIERYMGADKLVPSFHNAITVAGLNFKIKLTLAGLLPTNFASFFTYTRDGNYPPVRIVAFDALLLLSPLDVARHSIGMAITNYICKVMSTDSSLLVRRRLAESALESLPVLVAMEELASPAQRADQEASREAKARKSGKPSKAKDDEALEDQLLRSLRALPGRSKNTRGAILSALTHEDADVQVQMCLIKMLELTLKPGSEPIPKPRLRLAGAGAGVGAGVAAQTPQVEYGGRLGRLSLSVPRSAEVAADYEAPWQGRTGEADDYYEPAPVQPPKKTKPPKAAKLTAAGKSGLSRVDEVACTGLLAKLKKNKHALYFQAPVDPVLSGARDYFDVIKHPMDLSTMQAKLSGGHYASRHEFHHDFKLLVDNAGAYNGAGSYVDEQAQALAKVFEKNWRRLEGTLGRMDVENQHAVALQGDMTEAALPPPPPTKQKQINKQSKVKLPPATAPAYDEPTAVAVAPMPGPTKNVSFRLSLGGSASTPPTPAAGESAPATPSASGGFKLKLGGSTFSAATPAATPAPAPEPPVAAAPVPDPPTYYDPFAMAPAASRLAGPPSQGYKQQTQASYHELPPAPAPVPVTQYEQLPAAPLPAVPVEMPALPAAAPSHKIKIKASKPSHDEQAYGAPAKKEKVHKVHADDGGAGHKKKHKKVNYAEDVPIPGVDVPAVEQVPVPGRPAILDTPEPARPDQWQEPAAAVDLTKAKAILNKMMGLHESFFFREPVDPNVLPTYHLEIAHPVCLLDMIRKVDRNQYGNYGELFADMDLLVANCEQFNTPNTDPIWFVLVLERHWRAEWEKASRMPYHTRRALEAFMKKLMKDGAAFMFLDPITDEIVPDYFNFVRRGDERDLKGIAKRLAQDRYRTIEDVDAEVQLMLHNCYTYNPPDNQVHKSGVELGKKWSEGLARVRQELGRKRVGGDKVGGVAKKAKY